MGHTYLDDNSPGTAARWYLRALAEDSTDFAAWRSLAMAYNTLGQLEAAREATTVALLYNYHDAETWALLDELGAEMGYLVRRRRIRKRAALRHRVDDSVELRVDRDLTQAERVAWLGYAYVRASWQMEGRYQARFDAETRYRPTFEEHFEAVTGLLQLWERERALDPTIRSPELDALTRIAHEGYLGAVSYTHLTLPTN